MPKGGSTNPMMGDDPFGQGSSGSIPMFNQHGTALSRSERQEMARRKGICVDCGIKTHEIKFLNRKPINNDHVYEGVCIKDNPTRIPPPVYQKWEQKFRPQQHKKVTPKQRLQHGVHRVSQVQQMLPPQRQERAVSSGSTASRSPLLSSRRIIPPLSSRNLEPSVSSMSASGHQSERSSFGSEGSRGGEASRAAFQQQQQASARVNAIAEHSRPNVHSEGRGRPVLAPAATDPIAYEDYKGSEEDAAEIMEALRKNQDNTRALKPRLHRLRNLGQEEHEGALFELKDIMEKYRRDSRIMAVSFGALMSVTALDKDAKEQAAECGAIAVMIDALRAAPNQRDADFITWALGAVCCLSRGSGNKAAIGDAGAIETIVNCLEQHPTNAAVFEWSCRALHSLVYQYDDDEEEGEEDGAIRKNIETIEDANGIKAVVSAMPNHISECGGQKWAVKLLWRLQDRDGESAALRVLGKIVDQDGVHVCVKLLKARSTTFSLYEITAALLYNLLATMSTVPDEAAECLTTTLRMMQEHPDEEVLQECCCLLVSALANGCKLQIKEANGLATIVDVMGRFSFTSELQEACSHILWTLSYIPAFFDYSIVSEALRVLKAAVEANQGATGLLTNTCAFIANVVLAPSVNPSDVPVNIPISVFALNSDDAALNNEACRALSNICVQDSVMTKQAVEAGAISALVKCMESASTQTLVSLFGALTAIADASDDNKKALMKENCHVVAKDNVQSCDSHAVKEKALALLATLVATEKRPAIPLPSDIFAVILESLRTDLTSAEQRQIGCAALQNLLAVSTPGSRTLKLGGITEFMVELIDNPSNSVDLKRDACGVVWALLGKHAKNNSTSELSSAFRSVLGVMSMYKGEDQPFNTELQSVAAGALVCITASIRENPIEVAVADIEEIIAIVYMAMEFDKQRTELYDKYLNVLLHLSFINEGAIIQCGGIVVVIDTMVEHEQVESIQQRGCAILALLSSTENLQVNLSIAETDGIDMIVNALAIFSENKNIQVDACNALSHLSVDEESRLLIASQGGMLLIVNAMNSDRDNIDMLEGACTTLLNLSADAEDESVADPSVVETIVGVMKYHPDSAKIQEKALGVLQNLSMRNAEAKAMIAQAGAIEAVVSAIREFMGTPTVLERAFTTIWSLAVLEQNQTAIADAEGIFLVVNGMMANISYEDVQKQACGCLCTLSSNSRNKTLIRDVGGVDAIVFAMWAHFDSEVLQTEACRALSSLAVNVETNEVMLASDGEINAIISAMRRFPKSAKLQEHACVALRNFMLSTDNAELMRGSTEELRAIMQTAAERYPDKCRDRAYQVLEGLG